MCCVKQKSRFCAVIQWQCLCHVCAESIRTCFCSNDGKKRVLCLSIYWYYRRSYNLFGVSARLGRISMEKRVDEEMSMVREDGRWINIEELLMLKTLWSDEKWQEYTFHQISASKLTVALHRQDYSYTRINASCPEVIRKRCLEEEEDVWGWGWIESF